MNKQEMEELRDFATKASKMLHNRCATGCLELLDLHAAQVAECERLRAVLKEIGEVTELEIFNLSQTGRDAEIVQRTVMKARYALQEQAATKGTRND